MTIETRIAELMALHKEDLARMIAESEFTDDTAKHEASAAETFAEVNVDKAKQIAERLSKEQVAAVDDTHK